MQDLARETLAQVDQEEVDERVPLVPGLQEPRLIVCVPSLEVWGGGGVPE